MRGLGRAVMTGAAALTVLLIGSVTAQQTGLFTDSRDKQTYKTVKIDKQIWMAQNLNYQTGNSWCYGGDNSNCDKYGRLYDWNTAKTVCPTGWKLPSREDWNRLVATAGGKEIAGKRLKSKSGWNENGNGTDNYGFSALPGGYRYPDGSLSINSAGNYGYWWTATEGGFSELVYYRGMDNINDGADEDFGHKSDGFSVRCLADT